MNFAIAQTAAPRQMSLNFQKMRNFEELRLRFAVGATIFLKVGPTKNLSLKADKGAECSEHIDILDS